MFLKDSAARRAILMRLQARHATMVALAAVAVLGWGALPIPAQPQSQPVELVPHRAVYELSLGKVRGKASVQNARGRILYDFTGSACEGYTLEFRQVAELDNGEGKISLSDLRSNTWEDGTAKTYRFTSQNHLNQKLLDAVDGQAERGSGGVAVTLTKPERRKVDLDAAIVFP